MNTFKTLGKWLDLLGPLVLMVAAMFMFFTGEHVAGMLFFIAGMVWQVDNRVKEVEMMTTAIFMALIQRATVQVKEIKEEEV